MKSKLIDTLCPFCGSDDLSFDKYWLGENITYGDNGYDYSVKCNGCSASGPLEDNEELAAEKWNKCKPKEILAETTVKQTRQVLMNELGLTRENIRKTMEDIVRETVEQKIKEDYGLSIDKIVEQTIDNAITTWKGNTTGELRTLVTKIITDQAKKDIEGKIKISLQ